MSQVDPTQFDDLLDQHFAGVIDEADFQRLQELLRGDAGLRSRFREMTDLHAALHEIVDDGGAVPESAEQSKSAPIHPTLPVVPGYLPAWVALTVLLTTAVIFLASGMNQPKTAEQPGGRAVDVVGTDYDGDPALIRTPAFVNSRKVDSVAMLQNEVAAQWGETHQSLRVGELVSTGLVELETGIAELVFLNGAVLVVEGPSRLELVSQSHCVLHAGKMRCFVPESALGFKVETSRSKYVDRGTEFALSVDATSEELHVFDGAVDVEPTVGSVDASLVTEGSGLRLLEAQRGRWTPIPSRPEKFADSDSIRNRKQLEDANQHRRWRAFMQDLANRDDVVTVFDFQPEQRMPQVLRNIATPGEDGSIVGGRWAEGRWEGKQSIEFKRPNDRIRIANIGEFENLTMSVWLRLDGFDREFNSILLTDRFEDGELHWQIKSSGEVDVGIKQRVGVRQRIIVTPRVLDYDDLGRWIHLVLVVDQAGDRVTNYIDGKQVSQASFWDTPSVSERETVTLRLGACELGNWSPDRDYDDWPLRGFNGRIDEFVVFNRALNVQEVRSLFEAGTTE
ncbi:MAG: LamG domain-containing protein [Planctomycetota bacterium]